MLKRTEQLNVIAQILSPFQWSRLFCCVKHGKMTIACQHRREIPRSTGRDKVLGVPTGCHKTCFHVEACLRKHFWDTLYIVIVATAKAIPIILADSVLGEEIHCYVVMSFQDYLTRFA